MAGLRLTTPFFSHFRPEIEALIQKSVHRPLGIGGMTIHWQGLTPSLQLEDINLYQKQPESSTRKAFALLHLQHLTISLSLWQSLVAWRLVPSQLTLQGASLHVLQKGPRDFVLMGSKAAASPVAKSQDASFSLHFLWWLFSKSDVSLSDINIHWQRPDGTELLLRQGAFMLKNRGKKHHMVGQVHLNSAPNATVNIIVDAVGNSQSFNNMRINAYVSGRQLSLAQLLQMQTFRGWTIVSGELGFDAWLSLQKGQWQRVQSLFYLQQAKFEHANAHRVTLPKVSGNVLWQRTKAGWTLAGDHMQLRLLKKDWPINGFSLIHATNRRESNWAFFSRYVNVTELAQFLRTVPGVKPAWSNMLAGLHPVGIVNNAHGLLSQTKHGALYWRAQGDFRQVGFSAWKTWPGASGLQGSIKASSQQIAMTLNAPDARFSYGAVFAHALGPLAIKTSLLMQHERAGGWRLTAYPFSIQQGTLTLQGQGSLWIPKRKPARIDLSAEGRVGNNPKAILAFLPDNILSKPLKQWLHGAIVSLKGGDVRAMVRGPLNAFPYGHGAGEFVIRGNIKGATLAYEKGYPPIKNIDGELIFHNRSLEILAQHGKLFGAVITQAKATIKDLTAQALTLRVSGQAKGDLSDGVEYIRLSPLQALLGPALSPLVLSGPMNLNLQLTIPLAKNKPLALRGALDFNKDNVILKGWPLVLTQLTGQLVFKQNGLWAKQLKGSLLGHAATLQVKTLEKPNGVPDYTEMHLQSVVDEKGLQTLAGHSLFSLLEGLTPYQAVLRIVYASGALTLNVNSSLAGMSIDLPTPLGKTVHAKAPLTLSADLTNPKQILVRGHYAQGVGLLLSLHEGVLDRLLIHFGKGILALPRSSGIWVTGGVHAVVWSQWQAVLAHISQAVAVEKVQHEEFKHFKGMRLLVAHVYAFGQHLRHVQTHLTRLSNRWELGLVSQAATGVIVIPDNKKTPIKANFDHLFLSKEASSAKPMELNPREIPPLDFSSQRVSYGDLTLSGLQLKLRPELQGVDIKEANITAPNMKMKSHGAWLKVAKENDSRLQGYIQSQHYGKLLQALDLTDNVAGKQGRVDFSLRWPGKPTDFVVSKLNGKADVTLGPGRIKDIGKDKQAEMGLGKVLSLLSVQSITRRLQFNFSDLTKSGFSYNNVHGSVILQHGNALLKKMQIVGPVANVALSGVIGLTRKDYHLQMKVVPHVTSTVPVVATVVGGPLVGAATWAATKLASPLLNKVTAYHYEVTGPWDKPVITSKSHHSR